MEQLPFKLAKKHKSNIKYDWKKQGLICSEHDFKYHIYPRYIWATQCDLCNKKFEKSLDRCMEHDHTNGKFRNIVCPNDVSPHITKQKHNSSKQGFRYQFRVKRYSKYIIRKQSIDLEFLKSFRDKWISENPQYFT